MADISVARLEGETFEVTITDARSSSAHLVTATPEALGRLAAGHAAEAVIEASFRFLLDREPKEAILSSFDLPVIGRYFPEYEQALPSYLGDD